MTKRPLSIALALCLLLSSVSYLWSALPSTINPSSPADTDPLSQGASNIRALRLSLIDILGIPNNTAVTSAALGIATDGRVNFPSALAGSTGGSHVTGYLKAQSSNAPLFVLPIPFGDGGTGLTSASDDTTLISSGSAWQAKTIPDCTVTAGHLNYTQSTNTFSCGALAASSSRVLLTSGDVTTGSSTLVNLTGASVTITTRGNPVLLGFSATGNSNTMSTVVGFNLLVDSIPQLGSGNTDGWAWTQNTGSQNYLYSWQYMTAALPAGSHTFQVQWRVSGGATATIEASSSRPLHFWAMEAH